MYENFIMEHEVHLFCGNVKLVLKRKNKTENSVPFLFNLEPICTLIIKILIIVTFLVY